MRSPLVAGFMVALFALVVSGPAQSATAGPVVVPPQVAAAWSFDTVGPDGQVVDASGHGRVLGLEGAWSVVPGASGTQAAELSLQSYGSAPDLSLAPGVNDVAVTAVLRALVKRPMQDSPNILQLGLFSDPGQVKMQISKDGRGRAECRFKGPAGALIVVGPATDITDGSWHSVTCWRQGGTLGVTVDGVTTSKGRTVGKISAVRPLTVGARGLAAGDRSDQFLGDLDVVVWAVGTNARTASVDYAGQLIRP